jgi:hypothetical protein
MGFRGKFTVKFTNSGDSGGGAFRIKNFVFKFKFRVRIQGKIKVKFRVKIEGKDFG